MLEHGYHGIVFFQVIGSFVPSLLSVMKAAQIIWPHAEKICDGTFWKFPLSWKYRDICDWVPVGQFWHSHILPSFHALFYLGLASHHSVWIARESRQYIRCFIWNPSFCHSFRRHIKNSILFFFLSLISNICTVNLILSYTSIICRQKTL